MVKLTGIKAEELKPVPEVVKALKVLTDLAATGELREFAYCGITKYHRPVWDYMGEVVDVNMMFINLTHLKNNYYSEVLVGEEDEE